MEMKPPWSNGQLRSLGKCIRDEIEPPENLPHYDEVMSWFNDVAVSAQQQIENMDWEPLLGDRKPRVTSRPKTIDTLRQKLQRSPNTPLQGIQDTAGVRFQADMTLDEQDAVVSAIVEHFGANPEECVKDLRISPHSGYRAVHIWLRLPARVEIQVRTILQGSWANAYESLADLLGREIRYDELPSNEVFRTTVLMLQDISTGLIARLEDMKNGQPESDAQLAQVLEVIDNLPDDAQPEFRERRQRAIDGNKRQKTRISEMEADVQAMLEEHKETFDTMRSERED